MISKPLLDKTDEWNAQCGHRMPGELVEKCLIREAYEESGADIECLFEVGNMKYETFENKERSYPPVTYIPVDIANICISKFYVYNLGHPINIKSFCQYKNWGYTTISC